MGESGSWYDVGFDGVEKEQRRLDEQQGPGRLWIAPGNSKEIVWVDDSAVCIYEHNPKMDGNYRNWMTCMQGVYDEVVCCQRLGPKSRYYVGYLTVVDMSEWLDGRGNSHQYELRLIQLKLRQLKKFRRKMEDRGVMKGTKWVLTREDSSSPTCGDDWDYQRDIEMKKLFEFANYRGKKLVDLWSEAEADPAAMARVQRIFKVAPGDDGTLPREIPCFNYFEILKPRPPKEVRLILGAVEKDDDSSSGGSSYGSRVSTPKEDDVPF